MKACRQKIWRFEVFIENIGLGKRLGNTGGKSHFQGQKWPQNLCSTITKIVITITAITIATLPLQLIPLQLLPLQIPFPRPDMTQKLVFSDTSHEVFLFSFYGKGANRNFVNMWQQCLNTFSVYNCQTCVVCLVPWTVLYHVLISERISYWHHEILSIYIKIIL